MRRRFLFTTILCLTAALSKAQNELPANPITPGIDLESPVITCGDVNNDGAVNIDDAIAVAHHIIGIKATTFIEDAADTNNDGKIDIRDVAVIISWLVDTGQQ
ncbi:MAG: dockerin type I repeat-containing protein [Prevotella sp.]|nr:dockerin type I repeat-containing protein [Prevotella sp.]